MTDKTLSNNSVYTFAEYNETKYSINKEGKFEAQEWSYYKDYHPAKYDVHYVKLGYTWIIKCKEDKVAILSGFIKEEDIKNIMESLSKSTEQPEEKEVEASE